MYRGTVAGLATAMIATGGLLIPVAPTTAAGVAPDWAPPRTGQGHPKGMVTLDNGTTIAISDGGWVTRRAAGESVWSPARRELDDVRRKAQTSAEWVKASGNSVIASFSTWTKFGSIRWTYVWRPGAGWSKSVGVKGLLWTAGNGVVGIDRKRFVPGHGWSTLPEIPLDAVAMAGDAKGRITAVAKENGTLRVARYTPGDGWARPVRITGADRSGGVKLAVNARGDRAIVLSNHKRALVFRKLGSGDWKRFATGRGSINRPQLQLDRFGRVTVVWERWKGDNPVYARRLGRDGTWGSPHVLGRGLSKFVLDGTAAGRVAVAYGSGAATRVAVRSSDDRWADPVRVAMYERNVGLAVSSDGCVTGYAWTGRLSRFSARTLGSCAGTQPEPTDPRTAWDWLARPPGERAYWDSHTQVARTTDGHTLLAWTSPKSKVRAVERTGSGFGDPKGLNPAGFGKCYVDDLAAVGATAHLVLDCFSGLSLNRRYVRTWTADSGWSAATRMPGRDTDPFDISGAGQLATALSTYSESRVKKVAYRPSPDAQWKTLPRPPAFGADYVEWAIHVTDDGDVVLVNDFGREYATYRQSTEAWSPVWKTPVETGGGYTEEWQVTDSGRMLTWTNTKRGDRYAVGEVGGGWSEPGMLPGGLRCRSFHLSDDGSIAVLETADRCDKRTVWQVRDFDPATSTWSDPTVVGRARLGGWVTFTGNASGDLLLQQVSRDRFGLVRPDTLWRRAAGSTSWSGPEYVPGGYDLDPAVLPDGTYVVTSRHRTVDPGVWLSLR